MIEHLYSVGIQHKKSKENCDLYVWAKNTDEATHKLTGTLIGYNCEYAWTCSGPVYKDNKLVSRTRTDT